ncbi:SymE family type I addiction module toxin [Lutibacter sp.]|uniref:SymE family type I addiction module toxin n=1 Tax=Lutibacter sp. TaxID=1925666 RepID=UPI0035627BA0
MSTFFSIRTLTISSQYFKNIWKKPTKTPKIIIQGVWLQNAGFEIGEKVQIKVKQNELIISKII